MQSVVDWKSLGSRSATFDPTRHGAGQHLIEIGEGLAWRIGGGHTGQQMHQHATPTLVS
jgi:hypothetical protein